MRDETTASGQFGEAAARAYAERREWLRGLPAPERKRLAARAREARREETRLAREQAERREQDVADLKNRLLMADKHLRYLPKFARPRRWVEKIGRQAGLMVDKRNREARQAIRNAFDNEMEQAYRAHEVGQRHARERQALENMRDRLRRDREVTRDGGRDRERQW